MQPNRGRSAAARRGTGGRGPSGVRPRRAAVRRHGRARRLAARLGDGGRRIQRHGLRSGDVFGRRLLAAVAGPAVAEEAAHPARACPAPARRTSPAAWRNCWPAAPPTPSVWCSSIPAYSYEEFVEGIKVRSVAVDGRHDLTYPVEEGLLCSFAARAAARAGRTARPDHRRDQPRQPAAHLRRTALSAGVPRAGGRTALFAPGLPLAGQPLPAGDDERRRPLDRPGRSRPAAAVLVPGDGAGSRRFCRRG